MTDEQYASFMETARILGRAARAQLMETCQSMGMNEDEASDFIHDAVSEIRINGQRVVAPRDDHKG